MTLDYLIEQTSAAERLGLVENADRFRGRVPDDLIAFWHTRGLVFSHRACITFVTPDRFDTHLDRLLASVPDYDPHDFAMVACDCLGSAYLWQRSGDFWIYDRPTGLLDNQSARNRVDPLPEGEDLAQLYADAGIEMPTEDAEAPLRALRDGPEDLTQILGDMIVSDSVRFALDADGAPLLSKLEARFGPAGPGQLFLSNDDIDSPRVESFALRDFDDAFSYMPAQVIVSVQMADGSIRSSTYSVK